MNASRILIGTCLYITSTEKLSGGEFVTTKLTKSTSKGPEVPKGPEEIIIYTGDV